MLFEYEFFSKDYIKFYMLNEIVNSKTASFKLFLESDGQEKDFLDVRNPERSVYRFNNFNVSEDATNDCITFRPNVVGCYVYFDIKSEKPIKVDIIKNGTSTVAQSYELSAGSSRLEFHPQSLKKYDLKINTEETAATNNTNQTNSSTVHINSDPFSLESDFSDFSSFDVSNNRLDAEPSVANLEDRSFDIENSSLFEASSNEMTLQTQNVSSHSYDEQLSSEEIKSRERTVDQMNISNSRLQSDIDALESNIADLEKRNRTLTDKKISLTSHLDKLQNEYDKDYSNYSSDVEEISSRYNIDAEILKLYADKDITPIEDLLKKAEDDIKQIEEQIKLFVEAQEQKTAEIEGELKIGKMQ